MSLWSPSPALYSPGRGEKLLPPSGPQQPGAVVTGVPGDWAGCPTGSPHSCCAQQTDCPAAPQGRENVPEQLGVIRHSTLNACGDSWASDPGPLLLPNLLSPPPYLAGDSPSPAKGTGMSFNPWPGSLTSTIRNKELGRQ